MATGNSTTPTASSEQAVHGPRSVLVDDNPGGTFDNVIAALSMLHRLNLGDCPSDDVMMGFKLTLTAIQEAIRFEDQRYPRNDKVGASPVITMRRKVRP